MLRTLITVAGGLFFVYGLLTVGAPFLMALVVAILMEPVHAWMVRRLRVTRWLAVTVSSTLFVIGGLGAMYGLVLKMISQSIELLKQLDVEMIQRVVQEFIAQLNEWQHYVPPEIVSRMQKTLSGQVQALETIATRVSGVLVQWVGSLPELLLTWLVFVISVYLFGYQLPQIKKVFLSFFEQRSQEKVESVLIKLRQSVVGFLRAQLFLSAITFFMAFFGLWMLDVEHVFAITVVIILVDVLPILGTGSVLVPWATYVFFQGDTKLAIGLVVLFVVITVVRRSIEPKVLGDSLGIATLPTLMSLYVGFQLFGPVGLLFGPLVVILYQAMVKVGLLTIRIRLEQ